MSAMRLCVALFAFCGAPLALAACAATPVLSFPQDDASTSTPDATLPDGAPNPGSPDSGPGDDGAAADGPTIPDAAIDVAQCGIGAGAPFGASCCGTIKCIGVACNHCQDCPAGCTEWCCAKENGQMRYQNDQCVGPPLNTTNCPLIEK
jgi:hypothetical protein